jgi:ferredoxin
VLGTKDESGRRRPEEVKGTEFVLECDMVISALGQKPEPQSVIGMELGKGGMIAADPITGATGTSGVFAGGDAVRVENIISAVAEGKKCAVSIDRMLAGTEAILEYEPDYPVVSKEDVLERGGYVKKHADVDLFTLTGADRVKDFERHERSLTMEEAVEEAKRCLSCGCGEGCGICAEICAEFAISKKAVDVWEIDEEKCVACGMCYNRCPNRNIAMINRCVKV